MSALKPVSCEPEKAYMIEMVLFEVAGPADSSVLSDDPPEAQPAVARIAVEARTARERLRCDISLLSKGRQADWLHCHGVS